MTSNPTFPCEGGCCCGSVRYRLLEDPLELHVCHCTDCQRLSGNAFIMTMSVHQRSLELHRGELTTFEFPTPQGTTRRDQRCSDCGSRMWSEPPRYPELRGLRPGTLDDTSWLNPIAHIWTASAQPWVSIPDGVLRYDKAPDDDLDLVRAWKHRVGGGRV